MEKFDTILQEGAANQASRIFENLKLCLSAKIPNTFILWPLELLQKQMSTSPHDLFYGPKKKFEICFGSPETIKTGFKYTFQINYNNCLIKITQGEKQQVTALNTFTHP